MPLTTLKPVSGNRRREAAKLALRALALKIGPNGKLPTIKELCQSLDVAKATVDTALDALEAEGVIRRKHGSGIYVTPRIGQKNIALVFGNNVFGADVSPVYPHIIERSRERAASHNENFSFFLDLPSMQADMPQVPVHGDLAEAIASGRVHGILLGIRNSVEEEVWLRAQGVPLVSLSLPAEYPFSVTVDYDALIRLSVQALAEQGCRRIGMITPFGYCRDDASAFQHRDREAFAESLSRLGLPQQKEWIWEDRTQHDDLTETREQQGARALRELLGDRPGPHPDGLVIADDMLTRGVLAAARQQGVSVGETVKIASHANKGSPALAEWAGQLTLVEVDPDEIVEAMFGMLERLMNGVGVEEKVAVIKPRVRRDAVVNVVA
jgi:DNA-binding LacI/PurR family transcriptional regulator